MRNIFQFIIAFFALFLFTDNCSETSTQTEDNLPEEFIGEWNAEQFVIASKVNPQLEIDMIEYGCSFCLIIDADRNYSISISIPDEEDKKDTGTVSYNNNVLTFISNSEGISKVSCTLSGNTLTIVNDEIGFDFDENDIEEPATYTVVLKKFDVNEYIVGHWTFNEESGDVAYDSSSYKNNGTIVNAERVTGYNGNALHFGENAYVNIPFSESLQPTEQITLEAIVKFENFDSSGAIISTNQNGLIKKLAWLTF